MAVATVLSGERRAKADAYKGVLGRATQDAKADAYKDVRGRATQDAKAEKHKISESSGRLAALALPARKRTNH